MGLGGAGADVLIGFSGTTLDGGPGADRLEGGTVTYASAPQGVSVNLLTGTAGGYGSDTLVDVTVVIGSEFDDVLKGDDSPNTLIGLGGNDRIIGRAGDDVIEGGPGADELFGNAGDDDISGGTQPDVIRGGSGNDHIDGGGAADVIWGQAGDDIIHGSAGADMLLGQRGADVLVGGFGDDDVAGGWHDDLLVGGPGDDIISGQEGDDTLDGGEGSDSLGGGAGTDTCLAGEAHSECEFFAAPGADVPAVWRRWLDAPRRGRLIVNERHASRGTLLGPHVVGRPVTARVTTSPRWILRLSVFVLAVAVAVPISTPHAIAASALFGDGVDLGRPGFRMVVDEDAGVAYISTEPGDIVVRGLRQQNGPRSLHTRHSGARAGTVRGWRPSVRSAAHRNMGARVRLDNRDGKPNVQHEPSAAPLGADLRLAAHRHRPLRSGRRR